MSTEAFDLFVAGRRAEGDETPVEDLMAQWLANQSGGAVFGGPAGEAPSVVALPDGES